jgi:hypothetical protein
MYSAASVRDRFRAYMKSFNPTAPAREMISSGLVVENLHSCLFKNLAARADLEPGSQQILVGGIGSGKTTELLLAERTLTEHPSTLAIYIDITAETDLSGLNSGALLAGFGLHLNRFAQPLIAKLSLKERMLLHGITRNLRAFALGSVTYERVEYEPDDVPPDPDYEEDGVYYVERKVIGKLKQPFPALQRDIQDIREPLSGMLEFLKPHYQDFVVLFDGMDRLVGPEKFWAVAHQDLRIFRELKISVLCTAPLSVLYGTGKSVSDHFDRVHHLPALTATKDGFGFLQNILEQRGASSLLRSELSERLCIASGGVLRDLISMARDSGEEAYVSGHELIESEDVEKSVRQLGTSYLRGLGTEQRKILISFNPKKSFDLSKTENLELLATRRILEYSSTDFEVHPALKEVLQDSIEPV